jgi:hypothetical protein
MALKKDYVLTFGKYKGKTLEFILHERPSYIIWLSENIANIKIDEDLLTDAFQRDMGDMAESEAILPKNWR